MLQFWRGSQRFRFWGRVHTHPVVKGNGSAIFMHLSEGELLNSSAGCVVLLQSDMEKLLRWMKPDLKPSILMGTENVLLQKLK